jgi:tRNA pseudouridine55 synthase
VRTPSPIGSGIVVVDKPAGVTSHDVVGRIRRLTGTRRVGHAGTLDPMATGVLVIGVDRATRLLGHLAMTTKAYDATMRLGVSTVTDDGEGEVTASHPTQAVTDAAIEAGVRALTGDIEQVPSAVSAVKVAGRRSYARVRAGESVTLASRPVTVHRFDLRSVRRVGDVIDLDASVVCSAGTYIRSLARDLGARLGVGGHLIRLRRTRAGRYTEDDAHTLDELATQFALISLDDAAASDFPRRDVDTADAVRLTHGARLPAAGIDRLYAAFGPDGSFLALLEDDGDVAKPVAVFAPPLDTGR